jgi:cardiolipin synthase
MANGAHPDSIPEDHQPLVSIKNHFTRDSKVKMRLQKNLWLTFDHTKTIVVDRKTLFIGGMNIGREYRYDWHDLMMEVDGPVVNTLQDEFNSAWAYAGLLGDLGRAFTRKGSNGADASDPGYPIRVLFTRTGDSQIYRAQLAAIRRSQKYIYIQTPYFSDDAMLQELLKARQRGVDVRVIIPKKGNWKVMDRSNKLAANTMLAYGIKVYLYPFMSHVKAAVYDGWACVGSANFDKASFRTNQEINLATSDPEAVQDLMERLFYPDFERSTLMAEPNPERFADHIYEIIADQM